MELGSEVGQDCPERSVELGSAPVQATSIAAASGHLYGWQAPDEPHVDDPELPCSHSMEHCEGIVIHVDEAAQLQFYCPSGKLR